jgi:hypothetical protein
VDSAEFGFNSGAVAGIGSESEAVQARLQTLDCLSGESERLASEMNCVRMDAGELGMRLSAEWRERSGSQGKKTWRIERVDCETDRAGERW